MSNLTLDHFVAMRRAFQATLPPPMFAIKCNVATDALVRRMIADALPDSPLDLYQRPPVYWDNTIPTGKVLVAETREVANLMAVAGADEVLAGAARGSGAAGIRPLAARGNTGGTSMLNYHARFDSGRVTTRVPKGYAIHVPRGWAVIDTCTGGDPRSELVTTAPLRWHPAYWLWRWRVRRLR